jgi:LysM repeat protein
LLTAPLWAQTYRSHRVKAGETISGIAADYGVSIEGLYGLNPDARRGVSENMVLILPEPGSDPVTFKRHKVKRKETLYSIAQRYGVTVDDIKRFNKKLYSEPLKKGDRLEIPVGLPKPIEEIAETKADDPAVETAVHEVKPKETRYGIARLYGISINQLDSLNPDLPENFPIGTRLIVPSQKVVEESAVVDEGFDFYEVQPKEGFFRLKVKLGLSQQEIIALNPYAAEGLKAGMILKVPKEEELSKGGNVVDLGDYLNNREARKVALMLPFQVPKFDTDSLELRTEIMREPRNNALRVALDFYSGVLMAADFARDKGMNIELQVFDTQGSLQAVREILDRNDLHSMDAVIGPLLKSNVEYVARELRSDNVPVISPLTNRSLDLTSNLFQSLPDNSRMEKAMLEYIKANRNGKNLLLITDDSRTPQRQAILSALPGIQSLAPKDGFIYQVDLEQSLRKEQQENWVILESDDPVLVSNVVGLLNGMPDEEYNIRLFTLMKGEVYDFDDISNMHLAKLRFTFPSVSRPFNPDDQQAFLMSYRNSYGVIPNKYAVRGFDLAYDIFLRLGTADDLYDACDPDVETHYVENRFRYDKKLLSGYRNQAFYLLQYNEELNLDIIE